MNSEPVGKNTVKNARTDRRVWTTIRVPPWKREEVPEASMRFAEERISYLKGAAFNCKLEYLLACAYLQGINDTVEAHIRNPSLSTAHPSDTRPERGEGA